METKTKRIWTVPNTLSLIRLLCVPLFLVLFFVFSPNYVPALIVFVCASITDVLDGFIARKFHLQTKLGMVLDPLADKCLKTATIFAFAFNGVISWWFFGVIFVIDLTMIITIALEKGRISLIDIPSPQLPQSKIKLVLL